MATTRVDFWKCCYYSPNFGILHCFGASWIPSDRYEQQRLLHLQLVSHPSLKDCVCESECFYIDINRWVMYSRDEGRSNLQWLHDTLLAAERNHERVHILKHLPSGGGSCYQFWSREYRRIIDRFHLIIGAQFNGHSHRDQFEIFYDAPTGQHAVNVAWNGGGATAFVRLNPNYHLYYVDRTHYVKLQFLLQNDFD